MNILSSSQNQSSSQFSRQDQQPDLKSLQIAVRQQIDPEQASRIASKLAVSMRNFKNQKFELCFKIVAKLIEKGYSKELAKFNVILQSMMDGFSAMARQIDSAPNSQFKVMCILSTIAQLIKEAPQLQICMKKRFLQSLLLIDEELLEISPIKKDILAVLGVLYQCISKQGKILRKFELTKQFKKAILSNYSLVEQQFSFILFNKALYNLATQGQSLSEAELKKYNVFSTLSKVIGTEQAFTVISKIKSALQKLNIRKNQHAHVKRSEMVAQV